MLALLLGLPLWTFWLIAIVFVIGDVWLLAVEWYGSSVSLTTLALAILVWFDLHSTTPWLATHAHTLYWAVPTYLGLGIVTAFGKWFLHVVRRVSWIKEAKATFIFKDAQAPDFRSALTRSGYDQEKYQSFDEALNAFKNDWVDERPKRQREAFVNHYRYHTRQEHPGVEIELYEADYAVGDSAIVQAISPRAVRNVGKITVWIYQWPMVVVSTLVEDVLLKLGRHLAKLLDNLFSRFVRRLVSDAISDL